MSEYIREQLIAALQNEHDYLIHDDFDPDKDMSSEEHLQWIKSLSLDVLKIEITESIDISNMFKEGENKDSVRDYMERWMKSSAIRQH